MEQNTTNISNTKSSVSDGGAYFDIDGVSTFIKLTSGLIACFPDTDYSIAQTGILKKQELNGAYGAFYWSASINGVVYIWDNNGHCTLDSEEDETHHLNIVASSINVAEGSTVTGTTRSGNTEDVKKVSVNSITPRDEFAIAAFKVLLSKYENPLEASNATITFIANKSYVYANAMLIASANAKYADSESTTSGTIEVDENSLTSNTEKLLYNIEQYLRGIDNNT